MYNLDKIYCTDAMEWLRNAPSDWINCVVTSPPYYNLRDYETEGQLGLENTPEKYVENLVTVFREIRRVLRPDGTVWLNLGDTYARISKKDSWLKRKGLIGIPWRVALALIDDGWILRSDVIWHKPNPMPESVTDRPTKAHEYVFMLTKSERYWYDADAVREPNAINPNWNYSSEKYRQEATRNRTGEKVQYAKGEKGWHGMSAAGPYGSGRNRRSVWTVPTEPKPFSHFAMFPQALIEPMILAGCPAQVCAVCGAPYARVIEREAVTKTNRDEPYAVASGMGTRPQLFTRQARDTVTLGWRATCSCAAATRPGIVYDPFMGSGTTALVAQRLGRHYIGTDINAEYVRLAQTRLQYGGDDRRMIKEIGV